MELLHTIHYTMSRDQNPSCIIADQYKRNVGQKMSFHFPSLAIVMTITVVGGHAFLGKSFEGKGSSVAGLALGWVGWVGKGSPFRAWGFNFCARGFNFVILLKYAAQL